MNDSKRQNLPAAPGLWIVATPIGNLQDLSSRALLALQAADRVLCEDTRRTARLTAHFGVRATLDRFDAHATDRQIGFWVEQLQEGKNLALVTDAGTPGISDPAAKLVAAARNVNISVTPIPGPSAVMTLLSVAGFNETPFTFRGFFPRKAGDQKLELQQAAASTLSRIFVWFESPERIEETLQLVVGCCPETQVVVGKELTKIHERFFAGSAAEVAVKIEQEIALEGKLGEWVFAILFPEPNRSREQNEENQTENSDWINALKCLLDAGISASDAARRVSQHFGAPKKSVYDAALKFSGKK